jgi:hypothetical protein
MWRIACEIGVKPHHSCRIFVCNKVMMESPGTGSECVTYSGSHPLPTKKERIGLNKVGVSRVHTTSSRQLIGKTLHVTMRYNSRGGGGGELDLALDN